MISILRSLTCIGQHTNQIEDLEKEEAGRNIDSQFVILRFIIVPRIIGVSRMNIVLLVTSKKLFIGHTLMRGIGTQTMENFQKPYSNTLTERNLLSIFHRYPQREVIIRSIKY